MFGGKGGVGKTTCAAISGVHFAAKGLRTLVISTDFTPSLKHIFKVEPLSMPSMVSQNLHITEVGYDEVKRLWDEKFGAEVYDVFSTFVDIKYPEFVNFVTSILPGLRDEFMVDYIREIARSGNFDKIVWDTAPAGQTLGLLRMPSIISQHLKPAPRIYSALKTSRQQKRSVLQIIQKWEDLSNQNIEFLQKDVAFNLVTIAEALAVYQLDDIIDELKSNSIKIENIIVNQLIDNPDSEFLITRAETQQKYLNEIKTKYGVNVISLPLRAQELRGIDKLSNMIPLLVKNINH